MLSEDPRTVLSGHFLIYIKLRCGLGALGAFFNLNKITRKYTLRLVDDELTIITTRFKCLDYFYMTTTNCFTLGFEQAAAAASEVFVAPFPLKVP